MIFPMIAPLSTVLIVKVNHPHAKFILRESILNAIVYNHVLW